MVFMTHFEYLEKLMTERNALAKNLITYHRLNVEPDIYNQALARYNQFNEEYNKLLISITNGTLDANGEME